MTDLPQDSDNFPTMMMAVPIGTEHTLLHRVDKPQLTMWTHMITNMIDIYYNYALRQLRLYATKYENSGVIIRRAPYIYLPGYMQNRSLYSISVGVDTGTNGDVVGVTQGNVCDGVEEYEDTNSSIVFSSECVHWEVDGLGKSEQIFPEEIAIVLSCLRLERDNIVPTVQLPLVRP